MRSIRSVSTDCALSLGMKSSIGARGETMYRCLTRVCRWEKDVHMMCTCGVGEMGYGSTTGAARRTRGTQCKDDQVILILVGEIPTRCLSSLCHVRMCVCESEGWHAIRTIQSFVITPRSRYQENRNHCGWSSSACDTVWEQAWARTARRARASFAMTRREPKPRHQPCKAVILISRSG